MLRPSHHITEGIALMDFRYFRYFRYFLSFFLVLSVAGNIASAISRGATTVTSPQLQVIGI